MSAIEHPAAKSGKITFCSGARQNVVDSAMKCATEHDEFGVRSRGGFTRERKESPVTSANWMTSSRW